MTGRKLTDAAIRAAEPAEKEYQLIDGGGLRLRVMRSGAKSWAVRVFTPAGMRHITLGAWPDMKLTAARAAAEKARQQATGNDTGRGHLHDAAEDALAALLGVFNVLRDELGRPVEVADLLRLLRMKPRK